MQVEIVCFDGRAWSKPFPDLNSDRTLVTVFGASSVSDQPEPIRELVTALPTSPKTARA